MRQKNARLTYKLHRAHFRDIYGIADKSQSQLPENRARESVLRALLFSTTAVIGLFFVLLLISYFFAGNTHIIWRLVANLVSLAYLLLIYFYMYRHRYHRSSIMLVALYVAISTCAVWVWGVNIPFALLMMSLTITLAGILLGSQYSLYVAILQGSIILIIQMLATLKLHIPDLNWQTDSPTKFGEAFGTCLLFAILAIISWMFGRQTEQALSQARQAETALKEQKKLLAIKLKARTEKLRAAQLKEMQQLYRFAELGQLSTVLFHELANHLSVLNLDLEDLKNERRAHALDGAKDSIAYIERLVDEVRRQLNQDEHRRVFNVGASLQELSTNLSSRFAKSKIDLLIEVPGHGQNMRIYGDPIQFSQIMTILVVNALEASVSGKGLPEVSLSRQRQVLVRVLIKSRTINISVSDWGVGVQPAMRAKIFRPFYGTKKDGMGIGLFMTKQIVETHFKGKINLDNYAKPTRFAIKLPRVL